MNTLGNGNPSFNPDYLPEPFEILRENGIALTDYTPGRHMALCPRCSAECKTAANRKRKILGVTIFADGRVMWGCNRCKWKGPEKGALSDAALAPRTNVAKFGKSTTAKGKTELPPPPSQPEEWKPILPVPAGVEQPEEELFHWDRNFPYLDGSEHLLCYVLRNDAHDDVEKTIRPLCYGILTTNGHAATGWFVRGPNNPRPLYGLNMLALYPEHSVVLCEGEPKADAVNRMAREDNVPLVGVSWMGGSNNVQNADFTPLAGRHVVVWPDADPPGNDAGRVAVTKLKTVAGALSVVNTAGLPLAFDAVDFERQGENLTEWLEHRVVWIRQAKKRRFTTVPFSQINHDTAAQYLVKDLIPSEALIVVWGPPKCGKSFWIADLALHIAAGLPYRSRDIHSAPVVYFALEGGKSFRKRVEAWRNHHSVSNAPFYLVTDRLDLVADQREIIADLTDQLPAHPALMVIDTLNRSLHGSENSDEDMSSYIKAADTLRAHFHCAVVVVHHCGIDAKRPRGHTSLWGANDCQIAVNRDIAGNIIATVEWMKDGDEGTTITSRLEVVDLGHDLAGEPVTTCIVLEAEAGPIAAKPRRRSQAAELFLRILADSIITHGSDQRPFPDGPTVRAVDLEIVRAEFLRQHAADSDDGKAKAFRRAVASAQADNLIASRKANATQWVWTARTDGQLRTGHNL